MVKKKLLALGIIAVMVLGQSGSVFAAGNYYVSELVRNTQYKLVTGSISYTPTSSDNKQLKEEIILTCKYGTKYVEHKKNGYGLNRVSVTMDNKISEYGDNLYFGENIGYVQNSSYGYERFGSTSRSF